MCTSRLLVFDCGHSTIHHISRCRRKSSLPRSESPQRACHSTPNLRLRFQGECYDCHSNALRKEREAKVAEAFARQLAARELMYEEQECSEMSWVPGENGTSTSIVEFNDELVEKDMKDLMIMLEKVDGDMGLLQNVYQPVWEDWT